MQTGFWNILLVCVPLQNNKNNSIGTVGIPYCLFGILKKAKSRKRNC